MAKGAELAKTAGAFLEQIVGPGRFRDRRAIGHLRQVLQPMPGAGQGHLDVPTAALFARLSTAANAPSAIK